MTYSLSLIDKAAEICGSHYKLAKRIDLAQSTISQIREGKRKLPIEVAPVLAHLCGIRPEDALVAVLLEQSVGTKREAELGEILGKVLAAGAVAASVFSYNVNETGVTARFQKSSGGTGNQGALLYRMHIAFAWGKRLAQRAGNRLRSQRQHPQAGPLGTVYQ